MKILVIRLSSLGDIVLAEPVIRALRSIYPDANIDFVVKPAFSDIVRIFTTNCTVINYEKSIAFHLSMLIVKYDLIVDLHYKLSSLLLAVFTPHTRYIHYPKHHGLRSRIVRKHNKSISQHTVEMYLETVLHLKQDVVIEKNISPRLSNPNTYSFHHKDMIGKHLIALFPGATHNTKRIPHNILIDLVHTRSTDCFFAILGSSSERDLCESIARACPENSINLAGMLSLDNLISIIDQADLTISNDSGPMHIAAALAKQQIAFFGATHPSLGFSPLNDYATIIVKNLSCQPCSLHGGISCPEKHFNCMKIISTNEISEAIDIRLRTIPKP